ncbi:unnamed protein product, partial [Durusdinium trenchii]
DVHDKQWGKSIRNMKGSSGSEQLVMMELFLSNLMREENFEHLLKEFIPQLEELEGLAENVVLGLSLANSLALQEAKEDTFDNLLQQLDSSKDEAVLRVILKDEHGQALVTKLKSKNTTLQDRFSKALKVGVFGEMLNDNATADAATFIEIMQGVAELGVTEADLENNELKTSFNRICSAFLDLSTKVLAGCGDLDPIFASLDGDSAIFTLATDILESNAITEMKSVAAVWNMPSVTKMFTVATANPGSVPGMLVDLSQVVSLATAFFTLVKRTTMDPNESDTATSFSTWKQDTIQFTLSTNCEDLQAISNALHDFCGMMCNLDIQSIKLKLAQCHGVRQANVFLDASQQVVSNCMPGLLTGLAQNLEKNLLTDQSWFLEAAPAPKFLPETGDVPKDFWNKCIQEMSANKAKSMYDTLDTVVNTLKKAECSISIDMQAIHREVLFNQLRGDACLCMDALQSTAAVKDAESELVPAIKGAAGTLDASVGKLCTDMKELPEAELARVKAWISKNIMVPLTGPFLAKATEEVQRAAAIPDAYEALVASRNGAKIRSIFFSKHTHTATTANLEDFNSIAKNFESIICSAGSIDILLSSQLSKIKGYSAKLARIKAYSSTVHGLNLCLHRFAGKGRMEKSALLR